MRKNFLILMLMALLPLAGWAATLEDATIIVPDITYGGAAPTVAKVQIGAVELNVSSDYTADYSKFYLDEACTDLVEDEDLNPVPAAKLPAGVYYYVKVTGAGTYSGSKGGKFFVNKKAITLTVTLPTTLEMTYDGQTYENVAAPTGTTVNLKSDSALATGEELTGDNGVLKGTLKMSYAATTANKTPDGTAISGKTAAAVEYSGLTADNYEIVIEDGTIDIYQFSIVDGDGALVSAMAISSTGNTVTYNAAEQNPTFTVKFNGTDVLSSFDVTLTSTANTNKNAGEATYKVAAKADGNFAGEYAGTAAAGDLDTYKLTIKKAAAFVKAKAQTRAYNGNTTKTTDNLFSSATDLLWTGVFTGDNITGNPTLNLTEAAKNVGEYTIAVTAPTGGWTIPNDNYVVGIDNSGVYSITKVGLTIAAKAKSVTYGSAEPTFTADDLTITGAIDADLTNLKKGLGAKLADDFDYASKGAGTYAGVIVPTVDPTKAATTFANYDYTNVTNGNLTIGAAQILFAIKAAEKNYGEDDPEDLAESFIVSGATEGLLTNPVVKRAEGEDVNTYLMSFETEATAQEGYEILYASTPVYFTINKAKLSFTIPTQSIAKDAKVTTLKKDDIVVAGINNDDDATTLYTLSFNTGVTTSGTGDDTKATADQTVDNGLLVTLTTAAQANYEIDSESDTYVSTTTAAGKLIVGAGTAATLNFTSVNADYATIVAHAGETQNVTLKITPRNTREVPAGTVHTWAAQTWNSMVLPFEVSVADLSRALGYAIVNRVNASETKEGNVVFKLEMDKIPANEPFCVKTTGAIAGTDVITFPNPVKIVAPESEYPSVKASNDELGYKFVGAYKTMTIDQTHPEYYFWRGDVAKSARIKSGSENTWTVVPFDAYIDQTGASESAPELIFTFQEIDGSVTAIKAVEVGAYGDNAVKTGWYNINGIKLEGAPTEKGVYINNGKKVVIK